MSVSGWETECCFSVFNKFLSCYWNGFTWNNRNYKITKGKLKIAVWETHFPLPTIPTISVSRETSIDLSSCHTHRSLKIPQTHPNKLPQFQQPSRFTWNTKPQQPIGERQRTLNAISCNSTIRSCFTWNHSSIFRTQQTYVSRETSGKHKNK